jgi:hypothetical protein
MWSHLNPEKAARQALKATARAGVRRSGGPTSLLLQCGRGG